MDTIDFDRLDPFVPRCHRSAVKNACERVFAAVMLAACTPLLAALVLAIRLTSRGPAVLKQERVGLNGRRFPMYKLRSMRFDAETESGAVWASEDDPRATRVGRVLRKLHLDELPQLANIVAGQMSFVGPRPERPCFVEQLSREIPGYVHRLAVRPGVTGLAQINLAPDQDVNCVRRKLELDLQYLFLGGLDVELRILAATLLKMIGVPRKAACKATLLDVASQVYAPSPVVAGGRQEGRRRRERRRREQPAEAAVSS